MCVCVCVCVCMCVCTRRCACVRMCACVRVFTCVYACLRLYVYICVWFHLSAVARFSSCLICKYFGGLLVSPSPPPPTHPSLETSSPTQCAYASRSLSSSLSPYPSCSLCLFSLSRFLSLNWTILSISPSHPPTILPCVSLMMVGHCSFPPSLPESFFCLTPDPPSLFIPPIPKSPSSSPGRAHLVRAPHQLLLDCWRLLFHCTMGRERLVGSIRC